MMAELRLEQVHYGYDRSKKEVLRGVDAVFPAGTLSAVVGRSGAGKSTLLYLLSGLDVPKTGQVLLDGRPLRRQELDAYRRDTVATVSQSYLLFPTRTALENVLYPLQLAGLGRREAVETAQACLKAVGLPQELYHRLPARLSGGEQQRVAVARCLAADSKVIAADEPTGNLDEQNAGEIMSLLLSLAHDRGKTVIMVTHDRGLAERADACWHLEYGKLVRM